MALQPKARNRVAGLAVLCLAGAMALTVVPAGGGRRAAGGGRRAAAGA